MSSNKRGYIARKYYAQDYGIKAIYEESIFKSYDSAYIFIKEISEEDHDRFLSEIVGYIIGDKEPWETEQTWTFDRKGELIRFDDAQKRYENCRVVEHDGYKSIYIEPEPNSFTGKYSVGNIVVIRAFPWNWQSPIPEDTIGVVGSTPYIYDKWIKQGNDKYDWDNTYVIYYIRDGYLDHIHNTEKGLELFQKEMPENLFFIKHLSDHFKGNVVIKEDILKDIFNCKIFVEKVRHFDSDDSIKT